MKILNWFKLLAYIVENYQKDQASIVENFGRVKSSVRSLDSKIAELTDIGVDYSYRGKDPNHIIIVGRYKNVDIVQTFSIHGQDLDYLMNLLKDMERHARVKFVDAPPEIRAVMKRNFIV